MWPGAQVTKRGFVLEAKAGGRTARSLPGPTTLKNLLAPLPADTQRAIDRGKTVPVRVTVT